MAFAVEHQQQRILAFESKFAELDAKMGEQDRAFKLGP